MKLTLYPFTVNHSRSSEQIDIDVESESVIWNKTEKCNSKKRSQENLDHKIEVTKVEIEIVFLSSEAAAEEKTFG